VVAAKLFHKLISSDGREIHGCCAVDFPPG
jgi:hypothetical protein